MTFVDGQVRSASFAATFKSVAVGWHKMLSRSRAASQGYLLLVSALSRNLVGERTATRITGLMIDPRVEWPPIDFRPRTVSAGRGTRFRLKPHLREFDLAALFSRRLDYEAPVFAWLEDNATSSYDAVIEIGANVGVYSVFLDALIGANPGARLKRIVSFEPALEPFIRLVDNLRANQTHSVTPYQAAIAEQTGMWQFFEPAGHLTNGSLDSRFANMFSNTVQESTIIALGPQVLRPLFENNPRVLVKVDVEGYEPILMGAFASIIAEFHPDFVIEILDETPNKIESLDWLAQYERYLITPNGLQHRDRLSAEKENRDWLLKSKSI